MEITNNIKNKPEFQLVSTVIEMAEKWNVSIANGKNIGKIGSCLFNTFGEAGIVFHKRIWKMYQPLQSESAIEQSYESLKKGTSRASFASFMYYAGNAGIKRMEYLVTYKDDHLAIA